MAPKPARSANCSDLDVPGLFDAPAGPPVSVVALSQAEYLPDANDDAPSDAIGTNDPEAIYARHTADSAGARLMRSPVSKRTADGKSRRGGAESPAPSKRR